MVLENFKRANGSTRCVHLNPSVWPPPRPKGGEGSPFRAGGFGATFPVAPGRVSGPVTPTPHGARDYGFRALGGVGCVESVCFTGCLRFTPQGRHSPSGHHKAPTWRVTRRAPRHSPHHSPEPGRQEFLKVHPALKGRGFQL
jgi:hypothetical protein